MSEEQFPVTEERRSGNDRRSDRPRRKESRWEPGKLPRRSNKDRRKKSTYDSEE